MADDPTPQDAQLAAMTGRSVPQKLLRAARRLDERALERLAALPGAPPLRPAHTRLFPHLDFRGVRTTQLAERLGISKQAVSKLVNELVGWGVLEQVPDPADGRARLVRFAGDGGLEGIAAGLEVLGQLEAEVVRRVGAERAAVFAEVLDAWLEVLDGPD